MNEKAKRVLAVWSTLTSDERTEAVKLINDFQNADEKLRQKIIMDSVNESRSMQKSTTMNFGPLQGGCPYCGR